MSDLIISINLDESKKKNKIIIETYEGAIPRLKSKKYSGQLRNVNINANNSYDNVTSVQLQQLREILNGTNNIQINKFQYMVSDKTLIGINDFISYSCLFYKDKKNGMYLIESIVINQGISRKAYTIGEVQIIGEKTCLYLLIDINKDEDVVRDVETKVFINISNKSYHLELMFDYGEIVVKYEDKDRLIDSKMYRDYGYEEQKLSQVTQCGWEYHKSNGFTYVGKNLGDDISKLADFGILVFTNNKKRIALADFSNIRVSYDMDWFSINGKVNLADSDIDVSQLINLKNKRENWVEYNGQIVFLPDSFNSKAIVSDVETGEIKISKSHVASAINIANELNGSVVKNLDLLISYNDIEVNIDDTIAGLLREYQLVGVKWLLSLKRNSFGACLADDMGLGKTLQIISFLSDVSNAETKNLIVVPKTLIINWQREIERFSPRTSIYIYHGLARDLRKCADKKITITTYQTLVNDFDVFSGCKFDTLIVDEAQYIKNSRSKAYNAINGITANMKIILTGTPVENNISEFWDLMKLINPEIVENFRNISRKQDVFVEKVRRMSAPFLLRRLKQDVLKDLPEKQEQVLMVKMETKQQELYNQMLESIRYEILRKNERFEMKSNSIMLNGLLYLQEICCHPQLLSKEYNLGCTESAKLDLLVDLMVDLYANNHKVVIFSRFTKMLSIIERRINGSHMNYYYLDGKTKDRMSVVDEFEKSNNGIFLISLKAGGIGINLTSADTAIIYDPWWNPASEKQATDRIYRIGQKKNVMIYRLIVQGTIEEKIQQLQKEKIELCSQILDGHEIPMALTAEIMQQLLLE